MATRLTDLTALSTPANADVIHIVDTSDTTHNAAGTSKKITYANFVNNVDKHANDAISDSDSFTFTHNFGRYASITMIDDSGVECLAQVTHDSVNACTVEFVPNFTGTIYAN